MNYQKEKVAYFNNKNATTLMRAKKKEEGGLGIDYIQ
jgi:hypothetical protein